MNTKKKTSNIAKPTTQVSITFTTTLDVKEFIEGYSAAVGNRRKMNGTDEFVGDISKGVNLILEYARTHTEVIEAWRSAEVKKLIDELGGASAK